MTRGFTRFLGDRSANFSVIVAVAAPVILGLAGLGLDYARLDQARSALQEAADGAALAGANELILASASDSQITSVAENFAIETLVDYAEVGEITVDASRTNSKTAVDVEITFQWTPMLAQVFDQRVTPIRVSARADTAGTGMACLIALMNAKIGPKSAIRLDRDALLTADKCAVFSNSVQPQSIQLMGNSKLNANTICTSGGYKLANTAAIAPAPVTDCPQSKDPLADRKPPQYGACTFKNLKISVDKQIEPGVYCGGLVVSKSAKVEMKPGIYVFKDGPLRVTNSATLQGTDVGIYFTGLLSVFRFEKNTSIDLSAPKTGPMAGLLMMEDPATPVTFTEDTEEGLDTIRQHRISSDGAQNLLGAIYLPKSVLVVDSKEPVASESPWTALIVGRLRLFGGPHLVLNGNYGEADVPVPGGIVGKRARLVH